MDPHLDGKVAVVTGASKGIGLAVVAGSRVTGSELAALTARLAVEPVSVDLATPDGPAQLVERAVAGFGGLDILVNNVGGLKFHPGGFLATTDADWQRAFDLNVL